MDRLLDPRYLAEELAVLERDPDNIEQMWLVAAIASRQGEYDEAITALERILIYFPRDSRVRVELGAMYSRLGAYASADRQFALAKTLGPTPEELARIAHFEPRVAAGLSGVTRIGEVRLTFGYAPNIDETSDAPQILDFDFLIPTPAKVSSASTTLLVTNTWVRTLDTARGEQLSFGLFAEATEYQNPAVNDQQRVGVELGALIPVGDGFGGYALEAKAKASRKFSGSDGFTTASLYAGVQRRSSSSLLKFGLETSSEEDTGNITLTTNKVSLAGAHRFSGKWSMGYGLHASRERGSTTGGEREIGGKVWASMTHGLPGLNATGILTASASVARIRADGPDVSVSSTLIGRHTKREISISETIRFSRGTDVSFAVGYVDQSSNIVNNRFDALSASISITQRF